MARIDPDNLAVQRFSLVELARLMMLDRAMQRLRDGSHRIPFRQELAGGPIPWLRWRDDALGLQGALDAQPAPVLILYRLRKLCGLGNCCRGGPQQREFEDSSSSGRPFWAHSRHSITGLVSAGVILAGSFR